MEHDAARSDATKADGTDDTKTGDTRTGDTGTDDAVRSSAPENTAGETHDGPGDDSADGDDTAARRYLADTPSGGVGSLTSDEDFGSGALRQPPPGHDEAKAKPGWKRYLLVYPILAVLLGVVAGVGVAASIHRPQVEDLDGFVPLLVTEIADRHEQTLATYSRENRIMLEEGELPQRLQHAIVATEDSNFFDHGGIDLKGVARAAVTNLRAGGIEEGASTITMQLARGIFSLTREQVWWRKIEESFLAVELEKEYSKQELLTLYANLVNLGHGNYGMEAAARAYFNKSVDELSLAEAATLAGIPQRPSDFSVYRNPEGVVKRRNWVLRRMLDEKYIDQASYDLAVAEPLLTSQRQKERAIGPYFSEEVRRYLLDTYGETELYDRGLQVVTTLDRTIQRTAENALREQLVALDHRKGWRGIERQLEAEDLEQRSLPSWGDAEPRPGEWFEGLVLETDARNATIKHGDMLYTLGRDGVEWTGKNRPDRLLTRGNVAWFRLEEPEEAGGEPTLILEQEPELEGAVVVIESATGAVRAMVGGWSYERNEFNRVTQARRQVGSAFKPFVFAAALESGYTAADTLFDGPVLFPGATKDDAYSPRNYYREYHGITTLRIALEKSINVTSVKLLDLVGAERVIELARRLGIASDLPPYPSLALGAADLSPLELAAAYAAFANGGIYVEPYLIETIAARNGRMLEENLPRAHKAMEPEEAYLMVQMLRGVAVRGTGASHLAGLDIETAGKTGTTDSYSDAWFVGFTPRYTILSWVGYDKKRPIGRGMTGAAAALPIWSAVVRSGLEDGWLEPGETFTPPPGIVTAEIEARSGLLWGPGGQRLLVESFVEGTVPERRHDPETSRVLALPWYLQEPFYLPKEGEKMPAEIRDWDLARAAWAKKAKGG